MNMKELEAAVKEMQQALHSDHTPNVTDQINGVAESLRKDMNGMAESLRHDMNGFGEALGNLRQRVEEIHTELVTRLNEREAVIAQLVERVGEMEPKVNSTNKSAPSKRNMTDEDALKVLTGECKELSHKEAAEKIGLTYAQVYSARLEFTFKHVHKELRDSGWKNNFIKQ